MPDAQGAGNQDSRLAFALGHAVAQGDLILRYQPKYDLFRRRITGVEALIRWPRPGYGEMPPAAFIPFAEESGLIIPMGAWVVTEACRQAAIWRQQGLALTVAVNVSARQLTSLAGFEATVADALAASGLPPSLLELEVTESVLMDASARQSLHRLAAAGIGIVLDDFGTGYSSLAYLRHLHATSLKIDKSFVDDLAASLSGCMLVDGIVRLAHSFGMTVVAEGVETNEQRDVLDTIGCDQVQGFILSRPIAAEAVPALMRGDGHDTSPRFVPPLSPQGMAA